MAEHHPSRTGVNQHSPPVGGWGACRRGAFRVGSLLSPNGPRGKTRSRLGDERPPQITGRIAAGYPAARDGTSGLRLPGRTTAPSGPRTQPEALHSLQAPVPFWAGLQTSVAVGAGRPGGFDGSAAAEPSTGSEAGTVRRSAGKTDAIHAGLVRGGQGRADFNRQTTAPLCAGEAGDWDIQHGLRRKTTR